MEMTTVPANAPNDVESTGILSVVELMIVAVAVMFTAVQFPVPPVRVMVGKDDKSKPWPPEIVKTTGDAVVALATVIFVACGCTLRAWHK